MNRAFARPRFKTSIRLAAAPKESVPLVEEIHTACIASVSFGASLDFVNRHHTMKQKWLVPLHHGELFVMVNLQDACEHALPKRLRVGELRINLTLRRILNV